MARFPKEGLVTAMHRFDCLAAAYRDAKAGYDRAKEARARAENAVADASKEIQAAKAALDEYVGSATS